MVVLGDGREVHLDDITTAAEGQSILDEIDAQILVIEGQLDRKDGSTDRAWLRRAETALKKKRRIRPALQRRIAELRQAEKRAATAAATSPRDAQRKAFVAAAEAMLDRELFVEIWARAAETEPVTFEGWGGVSA